MSPTPGGGGGGGGGGGAGAGFTLGISGTASPAVNSVAPAAVTAVASSAAFGNVPPLGEAVALRDILHQGCLISGAVLQV